MKYINRFENINIVEPKVGDYVIMKCNNMELNEYLKNNIGLIFGISNENYDQIEPYQIFFDDINDLLDFHKNSDGTKYENCIPFSRRNIVYFSKNKEDLEIILDTKKYNL